MRTDPTSAACGELAPRGSGRINSATGRPRFKILTASPVSATLSRIARHFALNSDAPMVFI